MVPIRIQPFFKISLQKTNGDISLTGGLLTCCNEYTFEVYVFGKEKHRLFLQTRLFPKNDTIVLKACCKKCGRNITVFDSRCDGYEHDKNYHNAEMIAEQFKCKKCQNTSFLVRIKYEYPDIQELQKLGIIEVDNAFSWIWITLECDKCGTKYKNFLDFETA